MEKAFLLISVLLIFGCTHSRPNRGTVLNAKFFHQDKGQCGVASLRSIYHYYQIKDDNIITIFNAKTQSTKLADLLRHAEKNFKTNLKKLTFSEIKDSILAGFPLLFFDFKKEMHYYFVIGIEEESKTIVVNDGYSESVHLEYQNMSANGIFITLSPRNTSLSNK